MLVAPSKRKCCPRRNPLQRDPNRGHSGARQACDRRVKGAGSRSGAGTAALPLITTSWPAHFVFILKGYEIISRGVTSKRGVNTCHVETALGFSVVIFESTKWDTTAAQKEISVFAPFVLT